MSGLDRWCQMRSPRNRSDLEDQGLRTMEGVMAGVLAVSDVGYGTSSGRWVLAATILGSGLASLDATVVNIALVSIGREFHAELTGLQWISNGYTLSLSALLLLGGALGDRFGRRRIMVVGVIWFSFGSLICGVAPNLSALIAAASFRESEAR